MTRTTLAAMLMVASSQAQVRYEEILKSPAENWLTYSGDYASQRHSPLKQINTTNVGSLVPMWVYHFEGARHLEVSPLVHDGIMYLNDANEVRAIDAARGRLLWRHRVEGVKNARASRGVAILGDRVYLLTSDVHIVALHRLTGALLWQRAFESSEKGYTTSLAPLALKNQVMVGVAFTTVIATVAVFVV